MNRSIGLREFVGIVVLAVLLTGAFAGELWSGGLVGGDVYSYFLPQKQLLSESLAAGTLPLWHPRTSFGYPLVAESQTGVFYPPNWLLYGAFDAHRAYHVSQLLHYVAGVIGMWWLARECGLSFRAAVLAAVIFVFGWFPPRLCLEWAIIGGCYLPYSLLCVERFVKSGRTSNLLLLTMLLGLQMTAGHFHLAFITQLMTATYATLRLFVPNANTASNAVPTTNAQPSPTRRLVLVAVAMLAAFTLAAVQLGPSWELKKISQRQTTTSREFDPGYGHIPPMYLSQVVASWWWWYSEDIDRDRALSELKVGAISSGTNQVEAHLYFGLLPLGFVLVALLRPDRRRSLLADGGWIWLLLAIASVIYATGWLLPIARHLPGFSFFRGLGRFGLITTLCMSMLAGCAGDLFLNRASKRDFVAFIVVILATVADLHVVSRQVRYSIPVSTPPYALLKDSAVRAEFSKSSDLVRLDAPGANLCNLLGVSAVPEYLGLGPIEYYEIPTAARLLDAAHPDAANVPLAIRLPRYLEWAEQSGITHVLLFEPVITEGYEDRLKLVFRGVDVFLNRAWGRAPHEPVFLYALPKSLGRASLTANSSGKVRIVDYEANRVSLDVELANAGTVVLRDLDYPGWHVSIDGQPATNKRVEPYFRGVEVTAGQHRIEWTFRPTGFAITVGLSLATLLGLIVLAIGEGRKRCQSSPHSISST